MIDSGGIDGSGNVQQLGGDVEQYGWQNSGEIGSHGYLTPPVLDLLRKYTPPRGSVLDVGCGNGNMTAEIARAGFQVAGIEPSSDGVARAKERHPDLNIEQGSAYDSLGGPFDTLVSAEVIEHLYSPRKLAERAREALKPSGHFIVTTPYHGYLKNIALAVAGKWDHHHTTLHEHLHIKFFSMATLGTLLQQAGFQVVEWRRVGRIPALAKSMIAVAQRLD